MRFGASPKKDPCLSGWLGAGRAPRAGIVFLFEGFRSNAARTTIVYSCSGGSSASSTTLSTSTTSSTSTALVLEVVVAVVAS